MKQAIALSLFAVLSACGGKHNDQQLYSETSPESTDPWSCVGSVSWPSTDAQLVTAELGFVNGVTAQALSDVSARVCAKSDEACANPIVEDLHSDAKGELSFRIQAGFDGYVLFESAGSAPGAYFFNPPLAEDRIVSRVPIWNLISLQAVVDKSLSHAAGHVLATVYNCKESPAGGVSVHADKDLPGETTAFYMSKGIPSTTLHETDDSGFFGLINVGSGVVTVSASLAQSQEDIGSVNLFIAPERITYTTLFPSPL